MQAVLIGTYDLPVESKEAFLGLIDEVRAYLKSRPGFIEDFRCEAQGDGNGRCRIVTVALWESEEAQANAAGAVAEWNRQRGVDTQALAKQMGVIGERVVYRRLPGE